MSDKDQVRALIDRHIKAFREGDLDAIMADYAVDCVMITAGTGPMKGLAAIRQAYEAILTQLFPPATTALEFQEPLIEGEIALLHFVATTPTVRTIGAFDSFVIRDGRIVGQTGGGEFLPVAEA